ncbi:MAG: COG1355, Predicted dioxygenase [uncultured Sulfurovum sp.]|uniref:MEMO1 family protein HELGO_WM7081 n=1 Tax=uncultured Sulfurovum sp. TaxID=269237 RepID=A0A6S6UEE1_9BACT|nr:MAG: COG1355, Predicted dioxygenase [uncultured Sulfurovum sp.]
MRRRELAVKGQFYPAKASEITSMIEAYNAKDSQEVHLHSRALIVPHAGYIYSGFTANKALKLLRNSEITRVVVIGPSHKVAFRGTSVAMYDVYETPLGALTIDTTFIAELSKNFDMKFLHQAHHEHSTEVQMPFIKYYRPDISVVELVYGKENPSTLANIIDYILEDKSTAVVISTDLSHYYDNDKANRLDNICIDAVKTMDVAKLKQGCEACGKIGIEAMLMVAKQQGLSPVVLDYRTSADAGLDKSEVVGYMSATFVEMETLKKETLLTLARASIANAVDVPYSYNLQNVLQENPWLEEKGAAFITLTKGEDSLRGCIGSTVAHKKLYEDVILNAKSAAMNDPRFLALSQKEYDEIKVEVSILSEPKEVRYSSVDDLKSKIQVGEDGVILKTDTYQATFLPQVWEQLPSFELFFSHLCKKAGMDHACLSMKPKILVYHAKKYKE